MSALDWMNELVTPALVVDLDRMQGNVQRMRKVAVTKGVSLRPHVKTHKTIEGAFYQVFGDDILEERVQRVQDPKCKITVSTLGEARFYAEHGFQDILYAVPLSVNKLQYALELMQKVNRFHVMFDHPSHLIAAEEFRKSG